MIFYLNLFQTLKKFSWANILMIKNITRIFIFVSVGKNGRCKIRLFSVYPEAIFKVTKDKKNIFSTLEMASG